jgi:nickel-dependent lactate racemase
MQEPFFEVARMQITVRLGQRNITCNVADERLVLGPRSLAADLADPVAVVRDALEQPYHFPALRRALTPDDHVCVVLDEDLPQLTGLLVPILEHITSAGVKPEAIALLCVRPGASRPWYEALPAPFAGMRLEVHDPGERTHLSYLATTRGGKRLYLNRTAVDADQLVALTGRYYDPLLGQGGAEGSLFPALGDAETLGDMSHRLSLAAPGPEPWPTRSEAEEVAWLLGTPFFVQIIEGAGDGIAAVVAGIAESTSEGQRQQDARWRQTAPRAADVVVATLTGDPARHTFAHFAAAAATAARVVKPGGSIVVLSDAAPDPGPSGEFLSGFEEPSEALARLKKTQTLELIPAWQWASAAATAHLYLYSGLPEETVEGLFATPLQKPEQVQRLLDHAGAVLIIEDAHKALIEIENS